jgi:formylglycine-generating enzyme required for sulfatase activity
MTGNVFEWCRDAFSGYAQAPQAGDGERLSASRDRVYRGGSFLYVASLARVAYRSRIDPSFRYYYLGLRPSRRIATE